MARHKHILSNPPVPSADDIFTDREAARDVLRGFFDELLARPFAPSRPLIQVFHGVGGAGKSALCKKAVDDYRAEMSDQGGYPLAFAHVDLDNDRITPAYPVFDLFAGRLRPALKDAGCALPLFDLFCLAWHGSSVGDGRVSAEQVQDFLGTQQKALEVAGAWWAPLGELATTLKGVDLVRRAAIAFRAARHAKRYAQRFPGLELTELREADFKRHAAEVLAGDLLDFLTEQGERNGHPRAVCITLDGFERIQSAACADDAQWALQELCSLLIVQEPQPRCGFTLFGRNRLQWRELYDQRDDPLEDTWDALLEQHLVGGLGEDDARHFLDRAEAWYAARPADPHCSAILPIVRRERDAILDAAEETAGEHPGRIFHLYSLDLALRQTGSHYRHFDAAKHLGRGHKDLQQRFLRYMDATLRSAMQALALALSFDEALFRLLVEKHAIKGIPVQDFHDLVGPGNGHVLPTGTGYRFHGKMQEALLAHLHDQPRGLQKVATVVGILVDYYAGQLAEAVESQDTAAMQAAYARAADILLIHAETGLLDVALFRSAFSALDKSLPAGLLARARLATWTRAAAILGTRRAREDEDTLAARNQIAHWTGQSGDAGSALALCELLLPDVRRVLGPDHPGTLTTRSNIAGWTGQTGDVGTALMLLKELLSDRQRILGSDHPDTLRTRINIAAWTGESGNAGMALALLEMLLPELQRVLGPDHSDTLTARHNIATWTSRCGDVGIALALFGALLPDRERTLGHDHPETLATRNNIAASTGESGDAAKALALFEALLLDVQRMVGVDHPDTLTTRNNIAHWTGQAGNAAKALALFEALLPDQQRQLGPGHPATLTTRANIAAWTGESGDARTALALMEALLPDRQRILGRDHPDTLATRAHIAGRTGGSGDARTALALLEALLPDQQRVLGPDHPDTLSTGANIAHWTGESGDAGTALALYEALLPDRLRVLGPDHPDMLTTRANIAAWTAERGDARTALALYEALLPDRLRVLGPDHPDTLATRANIAGRIGESGDAGTALALYEVLLPDQRRILGPDHPHTLTTQGWIARLEWQLSANTEAESSPSRNSACPCGSGRRYKHCHGRLS
ncbi:tetratricopeptide repeat protein [Zoogloea sp.]|uniref:tetratricopeptide repeat protein n=1 Tax=Zoogloea sp. TaxID=49181 RepID=UPI00258B2C1D|nr:tetratricopeptide repeat protein [Zoogloea sp.]MDD2669537.1 tetratricopeptide repeat protein [Zoogloea sp.]